MHDPADYPPSMAKIVKDANCLEDPVVMRPIELAKCSPQYLFETLIRQLEAGERLHLYRMTDGYTKSWSCSAYGFVKG